MRAFSNKQYDYYRLKHALGYKADEDEWVIPAGAIFVHINDEDTSYLKLCSTPEGEPYSHLCGDINILSVAFRNSDLFELAQAGIHDCQGST